MRHVISRLLQGASRAVRRRLSPQTFAVVNRSVLNEEAARETAELRGWPQDVTLNLSNQCNMRCRICNITQLEGRSSFARNVVQYGDFLGLSDIMMGATSIDFNGFIGESLMNPDFVRIARWFKARGARTCVSTNGLSLTAEKRRDLIAMGFDHVNFSLHGATEATYAKLQSPHFRTVTEHVRSLVALRRELGASRPVVSIMHAMNKVNVGELKIMLDLTVDLGADCLAIYHYRDYGYTGIELDGEPSMANAAIDELYGYARSRAVLHLLPAIRPYYRSEEVPTDVEDSAPEVRCELPWRGLQLIGSCVHPETCYFGVCSMFRIMRLNYGRHLRRYGRIRTEELLNHPVLRFLRATANSRPGRPRNPLCRFCKSRWRDHLKNTDTVLCAKVKNERLREFYAQFQEWHTGSPPSIEGAELMREEDPEFMVVREENRPEGAAEC